MACRVDRAADLGPELQPRLFAREPIPAAVFELVKRGALFVVNHSGGKDSQATCRSTISRPPRCSRKSRSASNSPIGSIVPA